MRLTLYRTKLFVSVGLALVVFAVLGFVNFTVTKSRESLPPEVRINGMVVSVTVAQDEASRERGLSGRSELPENEGMLFVFERAATRGVHMKDMQFAIDVVWIGSDQRVLGIIQDLRPDTYPTIFFSPAPILYALEVRSGWVERHRIKTGDGVSLPPTAK